MRNIFKIASLLSAAVMLFSCGGENGDPTGGTDVTDAEIVIVSDKDVIQSNGKDVATIKVLVDGKDVTAEAEIYNDKNELMNLAGGQFVATKNGEYKFWATYGTYSTFDKKLDDNGLFTIKAISVPVPEAVEDSQPDKTSFEHRAFLVQYTGTGCGYCPYMIKILKGFMADNTIPEKAVLAAVHSGYNSNDPAAISGPTVSNYPFLHVDLVNGFSHTQGATALKGLINESIAGSAKAGISVNPALYDDGTLVLKVSVKAAADGVFNVGAWLLEDNIYGQQTDYDNVGDASYNYHENCVRITDSKYKGTYFGFPLGTLKKGEVAHKTFVMNLKSKWEVENLHAAVFVSYGTKRGSAVSYSVCNAIDCPIDEPTPFDYK